MKRTLAVLLCICMCLVTAACGGKSAPAPEASAPAEATEQVSGPAYVTEPISIDFWHTMGSGALAEYMDDAVSRFNAENEYGITVNATFMGSYGDVRNQVITSIGAKENPQVIINGMSDILAKVGVLQDMAPYAERDGIDMSQYQEGAKSSMYNDGMLTNMPIQRSCIVLYYNKDLFSAAGYDEAPATYEELMEAAQKITQTTGKYGFELMIDPAFYQEALLISLGAEGICDADAKGAGCLDDGSMLRMLEDWRAGVDAGWMLAPSVSSSHNNMYQELYGGNLASFFASSAVLETVTSYAQESGINVGVAPMPVYGGIGGVGGGGDISIISANNSEQQIAAAWEFVKFMMSDEEIATRSMATGYMPVTEGSAELMKDFFAENEFFAEAYDARLKSVDYPSNLEKSEWITQLTTAFSYVIQDRSMSAEEGVDYLKSMMSTVFLG